MNNKKIEIIPMVILIIAGIIGVTIEIFIHHKFKNKNTNETIIYTEAPLEMATPIDLLDDNTSEEEISIEQYIEPDNLYNTEESINETTQQITTEIIIDSTNQTITDEQLMSIGISRDEFNIIVGTVYCEIRGGSENAIANVVNVIRNRVGDERFPNTYYEVCTQSGQFVWSYNSYPELEQSVFNALLNGDTTNGALYFCTCFNCGRGDNHTHLFTDDAGHHFWR